MLALPPPSAIIESTSALNVAAQSEVKTEVPVQIPATPTYESLKGVSRSLAQGLASVDQREANRILTLFEHQPFERHADGVTSIDFKDLAANRSNEFYSRLVNAVDRMGESGAPRALLRMALHNELPVAWRKQASAKLLERVHKPELVGQSPLIKAYLELAKDSEDPEIAFQAGCRLGSSKLRGFESLALMSFYLDRRWEIQPEAHRGLVRAVADMYPHLSARDRETARGILSKLRASPDINTAEICRTCRGMGIGMWLSAPIDMFARWVKG